MIRKITEKERWESLDSSQQERIRILAPTRRLMAKLLRSIVFRIGTKYLNDTVKKTQQLNEEKQ